MILQIVRKCIEWLLQLHLRTKHIHLSSLYSHVDRHADYTMFVMALTLISLKAVYTMIHSLCSVRNISCFYILVNAIFEQGIDWGSVWSCLWKMNFRNFSDKSCVWSCLSFDCKPACYFVIIKPFKCKVCTVCQNYLFSFWHGPLLNI